MAFRRTSLAAWLPVVLVDTEGLHAPVHMGATDNPLATEGRQVCTCTCVQMLAGMH